jgi:hypothetical protein
MRLYLLFLVTAFVLGGVGVGRPLLRRPALLAAGCLVVGSFFYSYRFIK